MGIEQQPGNDLEINRLGCKLSLAIGCPVTLVYDKPVFSCSHNVHFLKWVVTDWPPDELRKYHRDNL